MRSIRATYEDGQVHFQEEQLPAGRMDVIVTFLNEGETTGRLPREAGKRFLEKWSGVLEGVDVEGWRDQKAEDLLRKHR